MQEICDVHVSLHALTGCELIIMGKIQPLVYNYEWKIAGCFNTIGSMDCVSD